MKKRVVKRKLNVKASHSKAMLRGLLESLVTYGKVETTLSRAKKMRSFADEQLNRTLKKGVTNVSYKKMGSKRLVVKVKSFVDFLKKQGKDINAGFTSMIRTKYRKGDNSLLVEVKLLGFEDFVKATVQKPRRRAKVEKKVKIQKKVTKKEKKLVKKVEKKVASKVVEPEVQKKAKRENIFKILGERFLGRKAQGPKIERKGHSTSRSGI